MSTTRTDRTQPTMSTRTSRTQPNTEWNGRVAPTRFITLITWLFTDELDYILTDEDWNAIYVNDSIGFPVQPTDRTARQPI